MCAVTTVAMEMLLRDFGALWGRFMTVFAYYFRFSVICYG
jgi:hypothetical protein